MLDISLASLFVKAGDPGSPVAFSPSRVRDRHLPTAARRLWNFLGPAPPRIPPERLREE